MSCRRISRMISLGQDQPLTHAQEQTIAEHVQQCAACRGLEETAAGLGAELARLTPSATSHHIAERAVEQWTEEIASREMASPRRYGWAGALSIAAVVIAIMAALVWAPRTGNRVPDGQPKVARTDKGEATHGQPPTTSVQQEIQAPDRTLVTTDHPRTKVGPDGPRGLKTPQAVTGDLHYVNVDFSTFARRWGRLTSDEALMVQRQTDKLVKRGDDFVLVSFPALAGRDERSARAAVAAYKQEKEIVDARLARKVALGVKGVSFSDLCERITKETGIEMSAGKTVADDKVTIFCKEKPLRDIMRQVSQVFGFSWRRSGEAGSYRYELVQDLRSQLLEEEMRNKDRNEALIALDREVERYRKYLDLSPEEARAKAATASLEDKELLEQLGGRNWGPAHLYFNLSPSDMSALRAGERLQFSSWQAGNERPMPAELEKGILESQTDVRIKGDASTGYNVRHVKEGGDGMLPANVPEARAKAALQLDRSELGRFVLTSTSGVAVPGSDGGRNSIDTGESLGMGESPSVRSPNNATANAKLARDSDLQQRVPIKPEPSVKLERDPLLPLFPDEKPEAQAALTGLRATSADVMEAIHKASGMDVIADYYTKFYKPGEVSSTGRTLFEALSKIGDTMRMKWTKQEGWLQLRSTGFFNDRLKEVPNRLLAKWASARKSQAHLTTDDLIEIAQLTDAQLDAANTGRGARAQYGLTEWELVRNGNLRPHWRFMEPLSAGQRASLMSDRGLALDHLPPSLQQQFVTTVVPCTELAGMGWVDLSNATLKLEYAPPIASQELSPVSPALKYTARFTCEVGIGGHGRWVASVETFRRSGRPAAP